ncbi:MAG: phytanoyl-CoA dioxygenase family protein [Planctomycetota bacterium]|nr:phytanoyl-CoA dioxygenase family protein [Planctomycetota bacterium]
MKVQIGKSEMEMDGPYINTDLRDSSAIASDAKALHARMDEDGYLLLRGLYDRQQVLAARGQMLDRMGEAGLLDPAAPRDQAVINPNGKWPADLHKALTRQPAFINLVESPQIMGFFDRFLSGPSRTYDYKWLRVVGTGGGTGLHYDVVYMGRGTLKLYTAWTPLGDIPIELGPLALCLGSHRFEKIKKTYGQMDVDRDHIDGWFSNDPIEVVDKYGGKWATTHFHPGDVILFGMFTMHASLKNTTNRFRLSSDTRYQLASEPVDERWIGSEPVAHSAPTPGVKHTSMDEARAKWGV